MKKKSLVELMAEYAAQRVNNDRRRSHAVFLVYRDDINALRKSGWNCMDIWRAMRDAGIVTFSYSSFLRYAHRWSDTAQPSATASTVQAIPTVPTASPPAASASGKPSPPATAAPPIGKVDMPIFGQNHKPRDPNRF